MKLFFEYVGPYLRLFPVLKINRTHDLYLKNRIMKFFDVSDFGKVRDIFEGQAFYDKVLLRSGAIICCHLYLEKKFDINELDISNIKLQMTVSGILFDVIPFEYGKLPIINVNKIINPMVFVGKKNELEFQICGFASVDSVKNNLIEITNLGWKNDELRFFIGFNELQDLKKVSLKI